MMKFLFSIGTKMLSLMIVLTIPVHLSAQPIRSNNQLNNAAQLCRQLLLSDTVYATEQSYRVTDDIIYTTDAEGYFKSLKPEGKWDDIDYTSGMRGAWRPSWHLYRLMLICRRYYATKDPLYLGAVHKGLSFWIKNDFKASNWWHNNINVPFTYSSLMLMLGEDVTTQEMSFLNNTIVKRIPVHKATGQNLLWQLDNEARVALINKNDTSFRRIINDMQNVIQVSTKEGIQPDYSFQQHGPMLQFGNYGFHFINSILFWMRVTANTSFAFDTAKQQVIFDYCSRGLRWTIYKGAMDITAVGRQIRSGYTVKRGIYLYDNFNLIKTFDKSDPCKYYLNGLNAEKPGCELMGNKSFWRSDYMIHTAGGKYMMSVKMHGPFVDKIESINTENLKGSFLNDGVCLVHRTGKEYLNIEPIWNWAMLPGITSDTSLDPSAPAVFHTKNTGGFTGQVSNGIIGISSMQYNRLGVTGSKSYFFINDMLVTLGAGIGSKNNASLITTVNQRLYNGKELVAGKKGNTTNWLWQDSIAYIFPGASQLVKTNTSFRKSNWNVIDGASDKAVADSVLSIYLSHAGTDTYTYIVKPGIDVKDTKKLSDQHPVQVLSNNKELQAIRLGNSVLAVFYTAGSLKVSEKNTIQVDQACMLIYNNTGNTAELWVSDPSRKNQELTVTLNGKDKKISLPQGDLIGSTRYVKN